MLKHFVVVVGTCVIANFASAQAGRYDQTGRFAGSYFCTGEHAGGVIFNQSTRRWEGTSFTADGRFVIIVEAGQLLEGAWLGQTAIEYSVRIRTHGEDYAPRCLPRQTPPEGIAISLNGDFSCGFLIDYQFSLSLGRYMRIHPFGYTYGDFESLTPFIEIGSCIKIN
jgi:hypothetical protein